MHQGAQAGVREGACAEVLRLRRGAVDGLTVWTVSTSIDLPDCDFHSFQSKYWGIIIYCYLFSVNYGHSELNTHHTSSMHERCDVTRLF